LKAGDGPGERHCASPAPRASGEVAVHDPRALETTLGRAFGDNAPAPGTRWPEALDGARRAPLARIR